MNLRRITQLALILSLFGLLLIYSFYPESQTVRSKISEINKDCTGYVDLVGRVERLSFSSNGNLIAEMVQGKSRIMVFLEDFFVEPGKNISVSGRANKFSNECWVFPDRVELR